MRTPAVTLVVQAQTAAGKGLWLHRLVTGFTPHYRVTASTPEGLKITFFTDYNNAYGYFNGLRG